MADNPTVNSGEVVTEERGGDWRAEEIDLPIFYRKKTIDEEELSRLAREGSLGALSAAVGRLWGDFLQFYRRTEEKKIATMEHNLRAARDRRSGNVFVTPKRLRRSGSGEDPNAYFEEQGVREWYADCCREMRDIAGQQRTAAREKVESWFRRLESLVDESSVPEPTTAGIVPDFGGATDADLATPSAWKGSCLAYAGAVCTLYALALSFLWPPGAAFEEGGTPAYERWIVYLREKCASWLRLLCNAPVH